MRIDIYFDTDIRTIRKKTGTIYAAIEAETGKQHYFLPIRETITDNAQGAAVTALHSVLAGDRERGEHSVEPYKGTSIVIHSTSRYITQSLYYLKKWAAEGWKTAKGGEIAHKEAWQEINCNLTGNLLEVVTERPESEALKRLKGEPNNESV